MDSNSAGQILPDWLYKRNFNTNNTLITNNLKTYMNQFSLMGSGQV